MFLMMVWGGNLVKQHLSDLFLSLFLQKGKNTAKNEISAN
jgi:hypothetical protein